MMRSRCNRRRWRDFAEINRAGLASLLALLRRWLLDGRLVGREYTARNPTPMAEAWLQAQPTA